MNLAPSHLRIRKSLPISGLAACALAIISSLHAAENVPSADWPLFRGNVLQNGVAVSTLPESLDTRWKFTAKDSIEGAPAISKGVVYVGSMDEYLYAIDLATGKEKWKYKAGPIAASPSVHDGAVYVGDVDGMFHCVDAATGAGRWKFETGGEIKGGANFAGDIVVFGSYGDETLYGLSKDGKLLWKFKTQGPVNGSPAVVGNRTFVAGCDSSLHVLDTATGKELLAVNLEGQAGATAAVLGDFLYVGTMSSQMLAIDWKKGEVVWKFEAGRRPREFYASAAVTNALVVVGSRDKRVHALERTTGREKWSVATKGNVDSSPVVVGERVYVGSLDGNLYVLDLDKGTILKTLPLGKGITGSPAVGENCLIMGTNEGVVYCLGGR
jgi:outer membrane protein assembly factor BamB